MSANRWDTVDILENAELDFLLAKTKKEKSDSNRRILREFGSLIMANEYSNFVTVGQLADYIQEHPGKLAKAA